MSQGDYSILMQVRDLLSQGQSLYKGGRETLSDSLKLEGLLLMRLGLSKKIEAMLHF